MSKLKISSRLAIAFILILILMGMGIIVGISQSNQTSEQVRFMQQVSQQSLAILQVNTDLITIKADLQQSLSEHDTAELVQVINRNSQLITDIDQAVLALQAVPELQSGHLELIQSLIEIRTEFPGQINQMAQLVNAVDWSAAELLMQSFLDQHLQVTQEIARQVNAEVIREQMDTLVLIEDTRQRALWVFGIAGLIILAVSGFLGFAITRSITSPLAALEQSTQALARGEFEHRIQIEGQDELSTLSRTLNKAAADLAELYASLEEKVRQRTEELNKRASQAETLYQGGRALAGTLNLNELLDLILFQLGEIIPYDRTSLMLQDGEALKIVAQRGFPNPEQAINLRVGIKNGDVFEQIYHTQQPLAIDEVTERPDWQ
ncbi:MAG TPA: HAMP domain-containing protein, partial [Anaerolineaceae bacterium]|nr:HAMP domain-containing protein [Anaerolineaceae bacterium]